MVSPIGALERCKAGVVGFYRLEGLGGPQRSEGRGPAAPCWVLTQCARHDWDNWTQHGTIALPIGALERCKAGLVGFYHLKGLGGPQRSEGRGSVVPSMVLTQCVRQDWDN